MSEKNLTPENLGSDQEQGLENNKRVKELKRQIVFLQTTLENTKKDLETRESNPNFQRAKKLFAEGYRLQHWGAILTDTMNEIILRKDKKEIGYWADGTNRNTEEAFEKLGLTETDDNDETLSYLSDLTEEE